MAKTILILGGSGLIGTHLALHFREGYRVFSSHFKHSSRIPGVTSLLVDVDNRDWLKRVMHIVEPTVVIYAVGPHDLQWSEGNVHKAELLYAGGVGTISSVLDLYQPKIIYLSSPYVFDGSHGNYRESDSVLPHEVLGKMKLGGENLIKSKFLNYLILRFSPLLGRSQGFRLSFLDQLRVQLSHQKPLSLSQHEIHSFAPVSGLVQLIAFLVESSLRNRVFHYGGLNKVSYFELGKAFARHFAYDESLILPAALPAAQSLSSHKKVLDFSLNSSQVMQELKVHPLLLQDTFDLLQKQLVTP